MRAGLSIGDFSRITHLSIKTLRRYHEAGLLEPAVVNPHTGYRYYTTAQVPTAQVIRRFRDLGMPVREVAELLSAPGPEARSALITDYLGRLETQLAETRAAVTSLRRLLQPASPPLQIELRAAQPLTTAAIRATVDHGEVLAWYGEAMAELDRTLGAARDAGRLRRAVRQRAVHRRARRRGRVRAGRPPAGRRPGRAVRGAGR